MLSGGNPQIAKAVGVAGAAAVEAYLAAIPDWKQAVGRQVDAIIEQTVPGVRKAVKWNSPLYGAPLVAGASEPGAESCWFLGMHCFAHYLKLAFFEGALLQPLPPGPSKQKMVRYLDIRADDTLDAAQLAEWVKQASRLPGEKL